MIQAFAFIFGLIFGSFLNVVIYRVPRGLSIVKPRSFCPECKKYIAWFHNIPVVSYIFLQGRCGNCFTRIPIRYPAVELAVGILFLLASYAISI